MVVSPPQLCPVTDCTTNYRPVLSSERALYNEEQSNYPTKERKKKNLVMGPKGVPDTKADRTTDRRSQQLDSYPEPNNTSTKVSYKRGRPTREEGAQREAKQKKQSEY
jgi:hypothetical protein